MTSLLFLFLFAGMFISPWLAVAVLPTAIIYGRFKNKKVALFMLIVLTIISLMLIYYNKVL